MDVAEAVAARHSVRQFLPEPVPAELLIELVEQAARAPSGGNLQPWRIYVVNGPAMSRFRSYLAGCPELEIPEYDVYPHKLWEPYRTNRFALGEQLYASILPGNLACTRSANSRATARSGLLVSIHSRSQ